MRHETDAYFKLTQDGESSWWSWGIVFWFTILGWMAAQIIIGIPIGISLLLASPELLNQMLEMNQSPSVIENEAKTSFLRTAFSISSLLGIIFWFTNRVTQSVTRQVFGWLSGIMIVISVVSLAKLLPLMSTPEMSELNSKIVEASPWTFMFILLSFPAALIAPYLGQKFIHKRSIKSLHTAASKIRWGRGLQAFLVTWVVLGAFTAVLHFTGISPVRSNFGAERFISYSLVCLLFLPLQSGTEEIIFRGYLNQGFNHLLKNKWVTFTITSLLFMAMHLGNPEALAGKESGLLTLTMSSYFLFGFIACLMVWMDNGLESAIGFHAANNTFAGIFVNYEGSVIPTPSLFMASSNPKIDVFVAIASLSLIALIMWKTRKPLS